MLHRNDGINSEAFIVLNFEKKIVIIMICTAVRLKIYFLL